jgi:hypothetical protein
MPLKHVFLIAAFLSLNALTVVRAADEKKDEAKKVAVKKEDRFYARGPEIEKLKTELSLTDDQIAKIKAAVAEVDKKSAEVSAQAAVKEAEEAVKKAKEALKAAEEKEKAASDNFDLLEEHKKAIYNNLPDDKKEKAQDLIHYKPKVEKKTVVKTEKKEEKK